MKSKTLEPIGRLKQGMGLGDINKSKSKYLEGIIVILLLYILIDNVYDRNNNPNSRMDQRAEQEDNYASSNSSVSQIEEETLPQKPPRRVRKTLLLILIIIAISSFYVGNTCLNRLQHSRNFYRALNFHLLEHQVFGVYWAGQTILNYPIMEYFQIGQFLHLLQNVRFWMGNMDQFAYGQVDQQALNATGQHLIVEYKNGTVVDYPWNLADGFTVPFSDKNESILEVKATLLRCQQMRVQFENIDLGNSHIWNILLTVEPFSDSSTVVRLYARQLIDLSEDHYIHFVMGIILGMVVLWEYIYMKKRRLQNFPFYFLSFFLIYSSILSFSPSVPFETVFIADGVTCFCAWICALKFTAKEDDYHISFLLKQSYLTIGRLFASFGPLLIGMSVFAYCCFCRYSGQFATFKQTFMSIFYICYYNMTYESMVVTQRSPLSMIFFVTLVLIFTICIYSGMLVSVFCSYVWSKREEKIKADIVNNLKIQCSSCDHKYKYSERVKPDPKASINLSQYLNIDFRNPTECIRFKKVLAAKIQRLRDHADQIVQLNHRQFVSLTDSHVLRGVYKEVLWSWDKRVQAISTDIK